MTRRARSLVVAAAAAAALGVTGAADAATYHGYVGPGFTISLLNANGNSVSRIPTGRHKFVIHDSSSAHNFVLRRGTTRLRGTTVAQTGVFTWRRVRIRAAKHVYFCKPHKSTMKGSFRGV